MWLFCCLALTSESWKTIRTKNTPVSSIMTQMHGLEILFTLAASLKNIVYMPIQNCMNFK